jgi:hypothetical protein
VIFLVSNSLELEANIKLRLKGLVSRVRGSRIPSSQYIGMFAGVTKPKPFQRKRAGLTTDENETLPALDEMRQIALDRYRGSGKPMHVDRSARRELAIEHMYDGHCSFAVESASGPSLEGYHDDAYLVFSERSIKYYSSYSSQRLVLKMEYDDIQSWDVEDDESNTPSRAFRVTQKTASSDNNGRQNQNTQNTVAYTFEFHLKSDNSYSLPSLLHLRHTVEFFWNQYLQLSNIPSLPHTTHGRCVARVFTLQGHQDPAPVPLGSLDVQDAEGRVVAGFSNERNRRASSVGRDSLGSVDGRSSGPVIGSGKFEAIRRNTSNSTTRRTSSSFFGSKSDAPCVERGGAREIWRYLVKHQGWLSKKGGIGPTGKKWLDRYFVLYSTAMGHYLSYYSSHGDSPLFSDKRAERNLIDLGKVTFIRPVSNQPDAPLYSFDVVTIEREWTLCAPNEDDMQLWLQLLTTAVDEDVAIVPDDELCFEVKALRDPSDRLVKFDYSTVIKVSAYGVSVGTRNSKFEYIERFFWCYTDFYKWSVQNQDGKLTLYVSVFSSNDFSQASKMDFEFRTRQAVQLASAIEFYIEKFMSIMYLKNEGEGGEGGGGQQQYASDDEFGDDDDQFGEVVADDDEPDSIAASVDLLSLDADISGSSVAVATAIPVSRDSNLPMATAAAAPAPPRATFDPFGDAPPPAPPNIDDGFGDAFGSGAGDNVQSAGDLLDAFTTPSTPTTREPTAAALANMNNNSIPAFLKGKNEGMLYSEPGFINIMLKQEWRGSQGRVSVCIVNAGQDVLDGFSAELLPVEDNAAALRSQASDLPKTTLAAGEQLVQQIMVECMQPFATMPGYRLKFTQKGAGGTRSCSYPLSLPVYLNCFFEPTTMEGDDFMSRWQKLNNPALQQQDVVTSQSPTLPAFVEQIVAQMRMSVIQGLSEKSGGICCVGTLRTGTPNASGGKISVGVLCRIEINAAAQAYRVTVRTAHAGVSSIIKDGLRARLLG